MFYKITGEIYREILSQEDGTWIISYDYPQSPVFISANQIMNYRKVAAPKQYLYMNSQEYKMSDAEKERLELIGPLIERDESIFDKRFRAETAKRIANENNTTQRRIIKIYYNYLAGKSLTQPKKSRTKKLNLYQDYQWAINQFYFSAKKMSLRDSYDAMLLQRYMTEDGILKDDIPTWSSFRHYYYDNAFHKRSKKKIARNGLSNYQRNERPLTGSAMKWKEKIGAYQMDATIADIYLVSRFDNSEIIGRPNIYIAVDTVTQLIAGIYVGLASGESAVMACLANAATDKVLFCKQHGIDICKEQWPSEGLPAEIITDKGRDFMSARVLELTKKYKIEFEALPPFRPDEKGLVEKTFDVLQQRYKPLLRGRGVIEPDAQERWAVDYKAQAVLDLNEFTKIIIHCVVYINSARILNNYMMGADMVAAGAKPISASLWMWYRNYKYDMTIPVYELEINQLILQRKEAVFSRKGIRHNKLWYVYENMEYMLEKLGTGKKVTIGYDDENTSYIYLIEDGEYIRFELSLSDHVYGGISLLEYQLLDKKNQQIKKELGRQELESRIGTTQNIQSIIEGAKREEKEKQSGKDIKQNRENERNRLS